jgi:hypothetical protein
MAKVLNPVNAKFAGKRHFKMAAQNSRPGGNASAARQPRGMGEAGSVSSHPMVVGSVAGVPGTPGKLGTCI